MNFNEIKQELAKKFENMSYYDFKQFEHELIVMYANKHPKTIYIDECGGVWIYEEDKE